MNPRALSLLLIFITFVTGCAPRLIAPSESEKLSLLLLEYPVINEATCSSFLAKLLAATTSSGSKPMRILLIDSVSPMALTPQPHVVVVSKGLLIAFENEGEAFFTIAHEVAHTELQHHKHPSLFGWLEPMPSRKEMELAADDLALTRLARTGYPAEDALAALTKAYNLSPSNDPAHSSEYPLLSERIAALLPRIAELAQEKFPRAVSHREYQECRANMARRR
jgi:predicted Zn-dependent protease